MITAGLAVKQAEGRKRCRNRLLPLVPWIDPHLLSSKRPEDFRDMYGRILNAAIGELDLLIVPCGGGGPLSGCAVPAATDSPATRSAGAWVSSPSTRNGTLAWAA